VIEQHILEIEKKRLVRLNLFVIILKIGILIFVGLSVFFKKKQI
tara:strand:- start:612 stop:743 length:132 start_codon:yes stop_codon:yes gene_type:complete